MRKSLVYGWGKLAVRRRMASFSRYALEVGDLKKPQWKARLERCVLLIFLG
jgi:hypothetical protein